MWLKRFFLTSEIEIVFSSMYQNKLRHKSLYSRALVPVYKLTSLSVFIQKISGLHEKMQKNSVLLQKGLHIM